VDDATDEINRQSSWLQGQVAEVHNGQNRTGCSQFFLTCDFDWGGSKRKKLNIWSIKLGPPPVAHLRWLRIPLFSPKISKILKSTPLTLLRLLPPILMALLMLQLTQTSQLHLLHRQILNIRQQQPLPLMPTVAVETPITLGPTSGLAQHSDNQPWDQLADPHWDQPVVIQQDLPLSTQWAYFRTN
jgi:hypothetical protein